MNVAEVISGGGVNGAVMHVLLLSQELSRQGHRVTILCRHDSWIADQVSGAAGIEVIESNLNRWPLDEADRVAGLLRSRGTQVVHTHMTRAHNFGVLLRYRAGLPCVATAHSHRRHWHWLLANHVIAVSDATRRFHRMRNFVPARKIETVHGFVDVDRMVLASGARDSTRAALGIEPRALLVGMIGDVLPRKGQLHLVRSMPAVLRQIPEARFLIAGAVRSTAYERQVRAEAARLGVASAVSWLGYRSDVPELLSALDLYVLPSLDEMFPVAALEALAAGRAVVLTQVGGTPECLQAKDAGVLIPPARPDRLATAIVELLSDVCRRQSMGETARCMVQAHFSVCSQAPRVAAVLERVAAAGGKHRATKVGRGG